MRWTASSSAPKPCSKPCAGAATRSEPGAEARTRTLRLFEPLATTSFTTTTWVSACRMAFPAFIPTCRRSDLGAVMRMPPSTTSGSFKHAKRQSNRLRPESRAPAWAGSGKKPQSPKKSTQQKAGGLATPGFSFSIQITQTFTSGPRDAGPLEPPPPLGPPGFRLALASAGELFRLRRDRTFDELEADLVLGSSPRP